MIWLQIVVIPVALLSIYYIYLSLKKEYISKYDFILWLVIWLSFLAVDLEPTLIHPVVGWLGAYRALDLLTIAGITITLTVVFYLYVTVKKLKCKVDKVVEELALRQFK